MNLKQPELGQTIIKLRQDKHLTQEELVEQCNLNVRTLQRIEAGEVTPRDYTIKAILGVLDYRPAEIISVATQSKVSKQLQIGFIGGIIYFILGFVEAGADLYSVANDSFSWFVIAYTLMKIVVVVSFSAFMWGFVGLGSHIGSPLIRISAWLMMLSIFASSSYDAISLIFDFDINDAFGDKMLQGVFLGWVNIAFGIGIMKANSKLGDLAGYAGGIEIFVGACFVTVVFSIGGLFASVLANLLEVILLYQVRSRNQDSPNNKI